MDSNGKTDNPYRVLKDETDKTDKIDKLIEQKTAEAKAAAKALEAGDIRKELKSLIKTDVYKGVNYDFNKPIHQGYVIDAINQKTGISKKNIQKFILDELSKNTNPNHVSIFDEYRDESVKEKSEEIKNIRNRKPVSESIDNIINAARKIKSEYGTKAYFNNLIEVIQKELSSNEKQLYPNSKKNDNNYQNDAAYQKAISEESKIIQVITTDVMYKLGITDTIDIFGDQTFDFVEEIFKGSEAIKTIENIEKKDVKGKPAFFEDLKMAIPPLSVFNLLKSIPLAGAQGGKPTTTTTTSTTSQPTTTTTSTTSQPTTTTTTSTTQTTTSTTIPTTIPTAASTTTTNTTAANTTAASTTANTTYTPTSAINPYLANSTNTYSVNHTTNYNYLLLNDNATDPNINPAINNNTDTANNTGYIAGGVVAGSFLAAIIAASIAANYFRTKNNTNLADSNNEKHFAANIQLTERIYNNDLKFDSYIDQKRLFDANIDTLIEGLEKERKTPKYINNQITDKTIIPYNKKIEENLIFLKNLKEEFSRFNEGGEYNNKNSINYNALNVHLAKCKHINSPSNSNVAYSSHTIIDLEPVSNQDQVDNFKNRVFADKSEGSIEVPAQFFNKVYDNKTHPINWTNAIEQTLSRSSSPSVGSLNSNRTPSPISSRRSSTSGSSSEEDLKVEDFEDSNTFQEPLPFKGSEKKQHNFVTNVTEAQRWQKNILSIL